ncbi:hypothetical protein C7B65_10890 [Phormidesmis priestleyi ULC007]|uniref:DUF4101 domain-containing protein n=1 Tax=Phormidesmis priestleyi ULC007 TaxID=1920490 RepID=A0A2T1DGH0_9CYAN|nr:hypothetical protein C7B65_10890 [Phormidesmis priestleyi ULC007]PZO53160.1 MAG: hypothetical protein DCF14_05860 [Phormidesmis priestleyi]
MQIILAVILVSLITACSANNLTPSNQIVRRAIALQATQTQQELSQQLRLKSPDLKVDRVKVTSQEPLAIQNLSAYRVQGNYDYTLKLSQRSVTQKDNPFEVYLQRQSEGKTWRLAQKQREENGSSWVTQLVE